MADTLLKCFPVAGTTRESAKDELLSGNRPSKFMTVLTPDTTPEMQLPSNFKEKYPDLMIMLDSWPTSNLQEEFKKYEDTIDFLRSK